ncbi:MAG: VOC family protein [Pseudomonadota bacterium]
MKLGAFSVSLNVKDLAASKAFYQALGFEDFADFSDNGYCMLKNGETVIGLFQGIIPANTLTFNPGWDQSAQPTDAFDDVRAIQAALKDNGLALAAETDADGSGPGHIMVMDPDGNAILIDQHV